MFNNHDRLYYTDALEKLQGTPIAICGVGALGSNIADRLARMGAGTLVAIDFDRVESGNLNNQIYTRDDIPAHKVSALESHIYSINPGLTFVAFRQRLTEQNATKVLRLSSLVIDTFDNAESRMLVHQTISDLDLPCLHVGLHTDYGAARWADDKYSVTDPTGVQACDYPLASPLVTIMAGVTCQVVMHYFQTREMINRAVTLRDLSVFDPDKFGGA